jgi:putative ABC transport system substrate-binding protein
MERRAFLALLVAALAGLDTAWARPAEKVRIGRLSPLTAETDRPFIGAFRTGLGQLGWVEGQDFTIVSRFAQGHPDRLSRLAGELVGQRVDVILTGSNPGALAAKTATSTIPIVLVTTGDPIGGGIVASLARPGGNVTGLTALGQVLSAKRLEVLREAVPGVTRVAVLVNPVSPYTRPFLQERERTARELGLELPVLEADTPDKLPGAFAALAGERANRVIDR